jgi:hypothetical protein
LCPSPVRTAALRAAHRANAEKSTGPVTAPGEAGVAWNGLPHGGRTDRLPEKLLGPAAGSRRKLPPPWGGAGRRRSGGPGTGRCPGGPIKLQLRCGAGRERWCAYEQSRNVLSFHGHYARDSTFDQGFRLRTDGGGSGWRSECNDLATGSREAGAGGGDAGRGFARNRAPGELAGTVAGAGSASAPTRPALGSVSHFPGLAAVTPLRVPATPGRTQEITQNPESRLLPPARESQA